MSDRLGYRLKMGIVIPSTNTTVQPETDTMRPAGVTNHIARIHIGDMPLGNDREFEAMVDAIEPGLFPAVDRVMSCAPAHLLMGMSIPTFWGGIEGAKALRARMEQRAGVPVTMGSESCIEALRLFPAVKKIGILTPYQPVGDAQVSRYFEESGYDVTAVHSLKSPSEVRIAHSSEADILDGFARLAALGIDAIVQVGTDLAVSDLVAAAEASLGIPIIAINTATYWLALRRSHILDRVQGLGKIFSDF
jgi:maleate isomerase